MTVLAISAEEATFWTSVVTAVITLILAGAAVWTARAARVSATAAQSAARATRAQTAPLLTLTGTFGVVRELGGEMYFEATTENVGLGPAFRISLEVRHPYWNIALEQIPALAPGGKKSRTWPLGFDHSTGIPPGDDRFWSDITAVSRYADIQNENQYEADFHVSPQASEWVDAVGDFEEYPSKFPFDLTGVRLVRGTA